MPRRVHAEDREFEERVQRIAFRMLVDEGWPEDNDLDALFARARQICSNGTMMKPLSYSLSPQVIEAAKARRSGRC